MLCKRGYDVAPAEASDILGGRVTRKANLPNGRVVIYDDDHFYKGGVLAELLVQNGCEATIITPAAKLSDWTYNTLEQHSIHKRLAQLGVEIVFNRGVVSVAPNQVVPNCVFSGASQAQGCEATDLITTKMQGDQVYRDLLTRSPNWPDAGIHSVKVIRDGEAPGPIAWATYAGHRNVREFDGSTPEGNPVFRRVIKELAT